jgi:hypothetical protein
MMSGAGCAGRARARKWAVGGSSGKFESVLPAVGPVICLMMMGLSPHRSQRGGHDAI